METAPDLLPWVDIENIQRYPDIFAPGEPVVVSEKLHGSACLLTYSVANGGKVQVSSKGFGAKGLALTEDPRNLYWRAVLAHDVPAVAARLAEKLGASRIGLFGEVYGAGVQDLGYGANARSGALSYAVFDVSAEISGQIRWLDPAELLEGELPLVPRLYECPYDIDKVLELASGQETVSGRELHLREGVVVRPAVERYSPVGGRQGDREGGEPRVSDPQGRHGVRVSPPDVPGPAHGGAGPRSIRGKGGPATGVRAHHSLLRPHSRELPPCGRGRSRTGPPGLAPRSAAKTTRPARCRERSRAAQPPGIAGHHPSDGPALLASGPATPRPPRPGARSRLRPRTSPASGPPGAGGSPSSGRRRCRPGWTVRRSPARGSRS